ncbi:MAG TPA: hypothetical protein VFA05_12005 [Gaiellaceae bacterium]|nr:hypothetical protein [Gaiellaceae bacterium]
MTPARLLLATGTVAASLAGVAPVVSHEASAASGPVVRAGSPTTLVVPKGARVLRGLPTGSAGAARDLRMTVVRASDGAVLFTGSPATFHLLPVVAGTKLVVTVHGSSRAAGSSLSWS